MSNNEFFDTYDDGFNEDKINFLGKNFLQFFKGKKGKFLDVGPGHGEVLILWDRLGYEDISSVDISRSVHSYITKIGYKCDLVSNTADYLENKKNTFSCIVLNDIIEHIEKNELIRFIKAVKESLTIGGVVIIKVPNAQSPHFSLGRYVDLTHTQSFTELSLTQLMKLSGFDKFKFYAEKTCFNKKNNLLKQFIAIYLITPLYFWWVRNIRAATAHDNPKILTQNIIVVSEK